MATRTRQGARGSIRVKDRESGTVYEVVVDLGPDPLTGNRRQRSKSFATRREAQKALTAWYAEIDAGVAVDRSGETVRDLLDRWLSDYATGRVRPSTMRSYQTTIRNHLVPHLGATRVQQLTPADVRGAYAAMRREGLGTRSVVLCHLRLRQALRMALADGLVPRVVTDAVQPPKDRPRELVVWTADQARAFLAVATSPETIAHQDNAVIWPLLLTTSLRRGEACALRWLDIDPDAGVIHVRQTLSGHGDVGPPKTPSSRHAAAAPASLLRALREHRVRQNERRLHMGAAWTDNGLVFCTPFGHYIHPDALHPTFKRLCKMASVPAIRIHDLRHTYATIALDLGVDLRDLSRQMGHHRTGVTLDIYGHLQPGGHTRVADRIEQGLFSPQRTADAMP